MSDTADPELCSLIISAKTTSKFRLASPLGLFCLKSFHGFVFRWEDRMYCLPCALFCHKNVGKSIQKTTTNKANCSKNIQKTSEYFNGRTQKETNVIL